MNRQKKGKQNEPREELSGQVVDWWLNSAGTWGHGKLKTLGGEISKICGCCESSGLVCRLDYRLSGNWEDSSYGRQFKFWDYVKIEPQNEDAIVAYLQKYANKIGWTIGARIFSLYGSKSIFELKENPCEVAAKIQGLSEEAALEASASLKVVEKWEGGRVELMGLFRGTGLPTKLIERLMEHRDYGVRAAEILKADPFRLMFENWPGCGFATCDKLYVRCGLPLDAPVRQKACLVSVMEETNNGSVWYVTSEILDGFRAKIGIPCDPETALEQAVFDNLIAHRIVTDEIFGAFDWVSAKRDAEDEQEIAEFLKEF